MIVREVDRAVALGEQPRLLPCAVVVDDEDLGARTLCLGRERRERERDESAQPDAGRQGIGGGELLCVHAC